ncbi:MAG TPA: lysylphosphatidylglycerol synthase transmembrane domain-containing protein, partial [Chloroflexota bacterium]|nr:lysylphosphatidylglycerol synthase transmembrane domain-containing protein [Chloroflexota bacterium]
LVGQLVNNGLPLRLGELVRIEALAARGVSRLAAASTIVVEKLGDGVALVLFAAILSLVVPFPPWLNRNGIVLGLIGAVVLVAGTLTIRPLMRLVDRRTDRVARVLSAVTTGLLTLRAPRVAVPVFVWTIAAWIVGLIVNYAALSACGIAPTTGLVVLVTVAGYAGGLLPAPPGRIGVFQVICAQAAISFGVDHAAAFVFANVEWVAVVVVPSALGGVSLLAGVVDRGNVRSLDGAPR